MHNMAITLMLRLFRTNWTAWIHLFIINTELIMILFRFTIGIIYFVKLFEVPSTQEKCIGSWISCLNKIRNLSKLVKMIQPVYPAFQNLGQKNFDIFHLVWSKSWSCHFVYMVRYIIPIIMIKGLRNIS